MIHFFETVLTAGLNGKASALRVLPVRVISTASGSQAIQWLRKNHDIKALVSTWTLPDMNDGELICRIKAVRPWLPTVVLLDNPFHQCEVAARRLGVSAVLSSDVQGEFLAHYMGQLLGCGLKLAAKESDYQ